MTTSERQLTSAMSFKRPDSSLSMIVLGSYALLWVGTLLAVLVAIPIAGYLRGGPAHPFPLATPGTPGMATFIAVNNVRAAAIPFLFAALKIGRRNWPVVLGDIVIGTSLTINVALGGLALGTYGTGLLSYLPQWPLEWGGLALALAGWRRARHGQREPFELLLLAIAAGIILCLAAIIETYAVPQS
jgi:hypothetical protein